MTITAAETFLSAALQAAATGWPVFPLQPGKKRPAIRDWETRATTDTTRIRRAWQGPYTGCNIGIATGPAGLVVIDLDTPKPDQSPAQAWAGEPGITDGKDVLAALAEHDGACYPTGTYTVATPTGGWHLYFHAPQTPELRNTTGALGWLVDTRAAGGYVLAAGSVIAGAVYTVVDDTDPVPLPDWLAVRLPEHGQQQPEAGTVDVPAMGSGYLAAAISGETQRVANAPQGQRNHALYIAAVALGQLGAGGALETENVRAALLTAAREHITNRAYSTRQAEATITSGIRAGAKRPRKVAA